MPAGLHDGALIVDTGINNGPFFKGIKQLKDAATSLKNTMARIWQEIGKSMDSYISAVQKSGTATRNASKAQKELQIEMQKIKVLKLFYLNYFYENKRVS